MFKIISNFFKRIWSVIDRCFILPITKLIIKISSYFGKRGKHIENWLSKTNTILIVSLILAVIVFIVVDQKILGYSESYAEVLKEQPVNVIYNEEAYVIEGIPEKADITLIGSHADLYFAKQSVAHYVDVDLSGLKPGTHRVNLKYSQGLTSIDYKVNPSVATVIIYPKISETRTLTVDILNKDRLNPKLVISNVQIENDKVVIKGAEKELKKVASVKALVDVKNIIKQEVGTTTLKDVPLKAYDENGDVVNVEIVPEKIDAEITITSPNKELPIRVIPKGEVAFGQAISAIDINETKVTVYGNEETLATLQYIPVEVDVSGLKDNHQYKMELSKPVGITSMSVNNVTVKVSLDKVSNKEIENVNIKYLNLNDKYTVQGFSDGDIKITVILKGVQSVLDQIKAEDITAYIDLKGLGEGEHEVDVQVEGTDVKVQYVAKTKKVRIRIQPK